MGRGKLSIAVTVAGMLGSTLAAARVPRPDGFDDEPVAGNSAAFVQAATSNHAVAYANAGTALLARGIGYGLFVAHGGGQRS